MHLYSEIFFFQVIPIDGVLLADLADDPTRVTGGHHPARDVFDDDRARADDDVVADADPGVDGDVGPDPDVVADMDGLAEFQLHVPHVLVDWVAGGVDADSRGQKDVVPDIDVAYVEDDQIVIGVEVFANVDMAAVIAMERRLDVKRVAGFGK